MFTSNMVFQNTMPHYVFKNIMEYGIGVLGGIPLCKQKDNGIPLCISKDNGEYGGDGVRKLGEQWVEELDGKKHMLKAVEPFELCQGCLFNCNQWGCCWKGFDSCHMGNYFIIKDLGILNEDGCLPSPWGGYPKIVRVGREGFCTYNVRFYLKHGRVYGFTLIEVTGNTRQEAIDAWNRRA